MATGFLAFALERLLRAGVQPRPLTAGDGERIADLYASTREAELSQVPWTPRQKRAFTDEQSSRQESHYALHYPMAERLALERAGEVIGRLYVDTTAVEVRLMEMTLLPAHRGAGLGTRIARAVVDYADALGVEASLHVEPSNPARRLYLRLGFEVRETRGFHEFLVRPVPREPGAGAPARDFPS